MSPIERLTNRGRAAQWTRERIDKLTTPELRALLENAERLQEPELAALCSELLDGRPGGHAPARRALRRGVSARLVSRRKAFETLEIKPKSRLWSRGAAREDGTVVFLLHAGEAKKDGGPPAYLLWAPNSDGALPWSDTPAGQERLAQCTAALARGSAQAVLVYGKDKERVDPGELLNLRVEKRGEEFWGSVLPAGS